MDAVFASQFDSHEAIKAACDAAAEDEGFSLAIKKTTRRGGKAGVITLASIAISTILPPTNRGLGLIRARKDRLPLQDSPPAFLRRRKLEASPTQSSKPHHHPMTPAITHSKYRAQLIADNLDHIIHLYNGGLKPALITCQLRGLCQNPEHDPDLKFLLAQHIRNAIALYRTQELAGRTPLQFLYDQLKDPSLGFFFRDTRDQEGRLTGLFIAPRTGIELWKRYPNVLLLDCTYKTNRVRMPLLNNVLANCKAYFPKAKRDDKNRVIRDPKFTTFLKEWHSLVNAPDEAAYEQRLQTFKEPGRHPEAAIAYAVNTWLDRWKEKIVLCFVNRVRHLGHTTTSIVEGMHASMKRFLWTSTGDLTSVFQRFKAFWRHQSDEILNSQQIGIHKTSTPNLSSWALKTIGKEFRAVPREVTDKSKPPPGRCDLQHHCSIKATLGLPCRHDIFNRLKDAAVAGVGAAGAVPFEMSHVDEFWHRENPQATNSNDVPLEPLPVRGKGRPKGSLNLEKAHAAIPRHSRSLREPSVTRPPGHRRQQRR
ncbi:uncharacterized protein HRG_11130 [Hirsutella rhossiliensis]|uniref:MULE transposase domain-containing protein n=1 Tax=Hirsutella rhossiliensis TaxID=111463 RepID=A0A9P8MMA5_9HYPO|nr:uncharacterized protein HRG_11130 [Hirsutella rhossiliensis]KAH0957639.1 hypothetical protein HRG_11130 [Hirsutella rhossiliensis]